MVKLDQTTRFSERRALGVLERRHFPPGSQHATREGRQAEARVGQELSGQARGAAESQARPERCVPGEAHATRHPRQDAHRHRNP